MPTDPGRMASKSPTIHTLSSTTTESYNKPNARPSLTDFHKRYINAQSDIEGPCLIFSAAPIELTNMLDEKKISYIIANTGGIIKLKAANQRDFKLLWSSANHLYERPNKKFIVTDTSC